MNSELWRTAQRLLALARSGLAYSPAPYDRERYEEIEQTALRLLEREAGFPEDSLRAALPLAAITTLGAIVGTCVAVQVDKRMLNLVIGVLIALMGVLLVTKPKLWEGQAQRRHPKWVVYGVFFLVGIYGGFIQAGVGFFFSGALALVAGFDLVNGNALKTVIIGCYTTISLIIFYVNGMVDVPVGLILAVGSMIGAVLGAKFTVSKGNNWVRYVLTVVVVISAAKMIMDAFR